MAEPAGAMRLQILGDVVLWQGDEPLGAAFSRQETLLLAYLLLHREAPQQRQHLAYMLWPDAPESRTRARLRKVLYDLRQSLPRADDCIESTPSTVWWLPEAPVAVDLIQFEEALDTADVAGARGDADAERDALAVATELYGGELFPSLYADWVLSAREALSQRFLRALTRRQALLEQAGDYRDALAVAEQLLRLDSLHEPAYRDLMRLHLALGNRAAAVRVYHTCVTELSRELGVRPSGETREVYEQLLRRDAASRAEPAVAAERRHPVSEVALPEIPAGVPGLVDRQAEVARLEALWWAGAGGASQVVVISGVAGIGKTRLAEDLVRWAEHQGSPAAIARCYEAEGGLPFGPVVEWLRSRPLPPLGEVWLHEIARLLPEVGDVGTDAIHPEPSVEDEVRCRQQRLFEALVRALLSWEASPPGTHGQAATAAPTVLLLDDVQWADDTALAWVHYLLRSADDPAMGSGRGLLLVLTLRSEAVLPVHPVAGWLRELRRLVTVTELHLGPLAEDDTVALAIQVAGHELDEAVVACILSETEGNALFVVEMVRSGLVEDVASRQIRDVVLACESQGMPPRVQSTIEGRLAQLSDEAQPVVGVAATIGRAFAYPVLVAASDQDQDTVLRALDELWRRHIIQETGPVAYDFTHAKLRQVAYAGLSRVRARILHGRVAEALESVYGGELDDVAGQIARHYALSGEAVKAADYYLRAGAVAERVYALDEARTDYEQALSLFREGASADWEVHVEAYLGLGRVLLKQQHARHAEKVLREGIDTGARSDSSASALARLYHWYGLALFAQAKYEAQVRATQEALALLSGDLAPAEIVLLQPTTPMDYPYPGVIPDALTRQLWYQAAEAVARLPYRPDYATVFKMAIAIRVLWKQTSEALRLVDVWEERLKDAGDRLDLGWMHQRRSDILARAGHLREAVEQLRKARSMLRAAENAEPARHWRWMTALWLLSLGDLTQALDHVDSVVRVAEQMGAAWNLGWGYWLRGQIRLCQGLVREAEADLCQAQETMSGGVADADVVTWLSCVSLARLHLSAGDRARAMAELRKAVAFSAPETPTPIGATFVIAPNMGLGLLLHLLEASASTTQEFRAICRGYPHRETLAPEGGPDYSVNYNALGYWHLEPVRPEGWNGSDHSVLDALTLPAPQGLPSGWAWIDPYGDCSYSGGATADGLEIGIMAANGRGLWGNNHSAPRVLRGIGGLREADGFALQAIASPAREDLPASGGLLLWIDADNFVRLDWGELGSRDVALLACKSGQDMLLGRGRLPDVDGNHRPAPAPRPERVWLRLEVMGDEVRTLVSLDGEAWWTTGSTTFQVSPDLQAGVYVTGRIERIIHPGAWPDGAAMRFSEVRCSALSVARERAAAGLKRHCRAGVGV